MFERFLIILGLVSMLPSQGCFDVVPCLIEEVTDDAPLVDALLQCGCPTEEIDTESARDLPPGEALCELAAGMLVNELGDELDATAASIDVARPVAHAGALTVGSIGVVGSPGRAAVPLRSAAISNALAALVSPEPFA